MMEELKPFTVERPWGDFRQFTCNNSSTVKILTIKPNESLSLQSHAKRSEFMKIIQGNGIVEMGEMKYDAKEGEEYHIPVGAKHRVTAGPLGLTYLEISLGIFEENDEVRYEDKYGRA